MEDIQSIEQEVRELREAVPFGNSAFQIQHFILNPHKGLARAYRQAALEMDAKFQALKSAQFRRERLQIDIEEISEQLQAAVGFAARRLQVDLAEKQHELEHEEKLLRDAAIELGYYREFLRRAPKMTREEFENAEREYWTERLLADAHREMLSAGTVSQGTITALEHLGVNPYAVRTDLMRKLRDADVLHLSPNTAGPVLVDPQDAAA